MKKEIKAGRVGFVTGLFMLSIISMANAAPINLSTWSEEGPGGGVWTVASGGGSVNQSVNSSTPTFFISDDPFINSEFSGSIRVNTTGDDDFIGFVFGYQQPFSGNGDAITDFDFILFDWKQLNQSGGASEGFYLTRVKGDFSNNTITHASAASAFWDHDDADADAGEFTTLASNLGSTKGWLDLTEYNFTLTYQTNNIKIVLDGGQFSNETIFDVAGSFDAGSFGFYNYSQGNVTYAGVAASAAPPGPAPIPEPSTMILMGSGMLGLIGWRMRRQRKV